MNISEAGGEGREGLVIYESPRASLPLLVTQTSAPEPYLVIILICIYSYKELHLLL